MSTWTNTTPGYRSKTITTAAGVTIVLHRPELSDKERAKRERAVEIALTNYGKESKR